MRYVQTQRDGKRAVIHGKNAQHSTGIEAFQKAPAVMLAAILQDYARDKESAEHEEQPHPSLSPRYKSQPPLLAVGEVSYHCAKNGECAEAVELLVIYGPRRL